MTKKQINAFIGYLTKYKTVRIVREESAPYEINIDESIDLSDQLD